MSNLNIKVNELDTAVFRIWGKFGHQLVCTKETCVRHKGHSPAFLWSKGLVHPSLLLYPLYHGEHELRQRVVGGGEGALPQHDALALSLQLLTRRRRQRALPHLLLLRGRGGRLAVLEER